MTNALDIFVVPLFRRDGQDQSYLPGLHILAAPKRAARGRAEERLVLHLTLPPDLALNADQQHRLLDDLAQGYFRTPGAVTSALREQAERLNAYFLLLNQKGQLGAVRLNMLSIREDRATLGQSGPLQAFLLDDAVIQHFYDPQASGRGLGLSKNVDVRFYQCELKAGSILLLLSELPTGWNEKTLSDVSGQKLSTLRRRFLSQAGPNLRATLIAAQPGNGRLSLLTSLETDQSAAAPEVATVHPRAVPAGPRVAKTQATAWESVEIPGSKQPSPENISPVSHSAVSESEINYFRDFSSRLKGIGKRVFPRLRTFLLRMLPEEPVFNLPRQTMAIIAIAVPLAVVVLVSVVYLQFGRVQLYTNYLTQAQSAAAVAEARQDTADIRAAWTTALFYAQRAVAYEKNTQTAAALAAQAQTALDNLDAIARVDFQPALFTNLPRTANITRMAATNTDLFMLNATDGSVLRAFLTGGGYQLDQDFHCEPGPYGGIIVSPLVDLALLPRGNKQGAVLVAMDGNGNLIYCFEGQRPLAVPLIPPDSNWGKPNAIAVENGNLYVLDPLTNAVWIYFGEDYSFAQPPRFFFGAEVPDMQNMLDLSMDGEDLYLLDADGHLVICTFNDALDNPTTCTDPAEFTDARAGRQSGAQIADAHFLQVQLTDPPEPSVYLFDPIVPAAYQFSTHLNLVRQFQSSSGLPGEVASAFTVSPNHAIFLAFQNEIYIGFMP
jgi:hypothetical protein